MKNATTSVAALLDNGCSAGVAAAAVAPWAAAAAAVLVPFNVGEGNTVNGGGLPNISNVWASTLWSEERRPL